MSTAETQIGVNTNLQQQDLSNLVSLGKIQLKKKWPAQYNTTSQQKKYEDQTTKFTKSVKT